MTARCTPNALGLAHSPAVKGPIWQPTSAACLSVYPLLTDLSLCPGITPLLLSPERSSPRPLPSFCRSHFFSSLSAADSELSFFLASFVRKATPRALAFSSPSTAFLGVFYFFWVS